MLFSFFLIIFLISVIDFIYKFMLIFSFLLYRHYIDPSEGYTFASITFSLR